MDGLRAWVPDSPYPFGVDRTLRVGQRATVTVDDNQPPPDRVQAAFDLVMMRYHWGQPVGRRHTRKARNLARKANR